MTVGFKSASIVVALSCAAASSAWAAEYGTVVSSTPIVAAVPVPQRECVDQPIVYQQPNTGVGALIGAITGAAIGNNVGGGAGRAAATGIGLVAGSIIGDRIEGDSAPPVASTVRQCRTVTRYENRTIGFDVVYDYQGVRRHAQLARDPGDRIALSVAVAPAYGAAPPVYSEAPAQAEYEVAPPQASYASPSYAPPVYLSPLPAVSIGLGYGWRDRGHRDEDGYGRRVREHRDDDGRGWRGHRD